MYIPTVDRDNSEELKSLSQIVLEAMRRYDFDVEKLGRLTGISERFIDALVGEKLDELPSAPYIRGYLKKIGEFLNLDGDKLWQVYLKDSQDIRRSGEKDKLPANRFAYSPLFSRSLIIVIVIIIVIIGYFVLRGGAIFGETDVRLINLKDNYVVSTEPEFIIKGSIDPLVALTMNVARIYPDSEGNFEIKVRLQPGLNTFEFRTEKFLGKEKIITKQIFYSNKDGQ